MVPSFYTYPSWQAVPDHGKYAACGQGVAHEITEDFGTTGTDFLLRLKENFPLALAACRRAVVVLIRPIRDCLVLPRKL
ncbi:hypothetical protein ACWGLF_44425 [Streptomyces puniciscabiei]